VIIMVGPVKKSTWDYAQRKVPKTVAEKIYTLVLVFWWRSGAGERVGGDGRGGGKERKEEEREESERKERVRRNRGEVFVSVLSCTFLVFVSYLSRICFCPPLAPSIPSVLSLFVFFSLTLL
jgi:hypothetical protein